MGGILQSLNMDLIRKRWNGCAQRGIFFIQQLITERMGAEGARIAQYMVFALPSQHGCT